MFSNNTNKPVFGAATTTSPFTFGTNSSTNQTSFLQSPPLGNSSSNTKFETSTPMFGSASHKSPGNVFLTSSPCTAQESGFGSNLFGQQQNASRNSVFGHSPALSQQNKASRLGYGTSTPLSEQLGTTFKFSPINGTDTITHKAVSRCINTRIHCIVCMEKYHAKSQEELRWEDYQCNRKGPLQESSSSTVPPFCFPAGTASFLFAQPENKPVFGQTENKVASGPTENKSAFGQRENKSVFGLTENNSVFGQTKNKSVFEQTENKSMCRQTKGKPVFGQLAALGLTSRPNQQTAFGKSCVSFGTTANPFSLNAGSSAFGTGAAEKPNSLSTAQNLFAPASQQSTLGSSLFGQANTQNTNSFNKPAQLMFNAQQLPQQTSAQSGLFQSKSTTSFSSFGMTDSAASFSSFGMTDSAASFSSLGKRDSASSFTFEQQPNASTHSLQNSFGSLQSPPRSASVQPVFDGYAQSNCFLPYAGGFPVPQQHCIGSELQSHEDFLATVEHVYETFPHRELFDGIPVKRCMESDATNPLALKKLVQEEVLPTASPDYKPKITLITNPRQLAHSSSLKFKLLEDGESHTSNNFKLKLSSGKRLRLRKTSPGKRGEALGDFKNMNLSNDDGLESVKVSSPEELNNDGASEVATRDQDKKPESGSSHTEINTEASDVALQDQDQKPRTRLPLTVRKKGLSSHLLKQTYEGLDKMVGQDRSDACAAAEIVWKNNTSEKHCTGQITQTIKGSLIDEDSSSDVQEGSPETTPEEVKMIVIRNECSNRLDNVSKMAENFKTDNTATLTPLENKNPNRVLTLHPCGVKLTRRDYYTIPSLDELYKYRTLSGECIVKGFTIGRYEYGSIHYPGKINVANLDLDEIVHFDFREAVIYPDDNNKPPVGQGLNRPAYITLNHVWPRHPITRQILKDPKDIEAVNFIERLAVLSKKQDAELKDYRPDNGSWVFYVEHLSKFSFSDTDHGQSTEKQVTAKQEQNMKRKETVEKSDKEKVSEEKDSSGDDTESISAHEDTKNAMLMKAAFFKEETATAVQENVRHQTLSRAKLASLKKDARNAMAMKMSFFNEELVSDNVSSNTDSARCSPTPSAPLTGYSSTTVCGLQRTVTCKPKHYVLQNPTCIVPVRRSLLALSLRNYVDVGLFKSKSFKVGWGSGFSLSTVPTRASEFDPSVINQGRNDYVANTVMCVNFGDLSSDSQMMYLEEHLKIVFEESTVTIDDSKVPLFTINKNYSSLIAHQHITQCMDKDRSINISHYKRVWSLCLALWGPNASTPTARRELFSKWLKDAALPVLQVELKLNDLKPSATIKNVFIYLTGDKIEEAAELAMNEGFPYLGVLISEASGQESSKGLIRDQLEQWKNNGTLNSIDKDILKIYMLLGGIPYISGINVCENLNWKRALAIYFWYMSPSGTSVIYSIQEYRKAFMMGRASPPSPEHYEATDVDICDVLYQIMMLLVTPTMPLERVVNPLNYSDDPLDYRLSWLLLQALVALKVGTVSQQLTNAIHVSFSSQLEHLGLWQWSIFVVLFIKDKSFKVNAIKSILGRHHDTDRTSEQSMTIEATLVNHFKIPPEWIHSTLANKTNLMQNHVETYKHLILANNWCGAHDVAVTHLIPTFISSGQYKELLSLLKSAIPGKGNILHWHRQAGLVLDFLELQQKIVGSMEAITKIDLRRLKSDLTELCCRVKDFPTSSLEQTVAVSEVSRFIAVLLKIFNSQLRPPYVENVRSMVDLIKQLVMPPDYKNN